MAAAASSKKESLFEDTAEVKGSPSSAQSEHRSEKKKKKKEKKEKKEKRDKVSKLLEHLSEYRIV